MKTFILKMTAYHYLEKNHYVSISEAGDMVTNRNSRVRYYVDLDKKCQHWIYFNYSKRRDKYGDFNVEGSPGNCLIRAGFDRVSKYNKTD